VLTLGIDLASQPRQTAACTVDWSSGELRVSAGWDDAALLQEFARADKVGIDAPLGWPEPFLRALAEDDWPAPGAPRQALERRATDLWIHRTTGKLPMSVSTDRIAYCAMRARVLIGAAPRDGSGRFVEAYPDAALRVWGVRGVGSYKGPTARGRRAAILAALGWDAPACVDSDHCLDALVCALIARAAALGLTHPPEDQRLARLEGWIHLPREGSLSRLVPAARDRTLR
jgi:predicted nuclease with RNAse H fold